MARRVLHLVGSAVSDFHCDLSRLYARDCLQVTADATRYEVTIAYVTPDGGWRFPSDLGDAAIASAARMPLSEALGQISGLGIELMVPQMFCLPGMTLYRGLFDMLGVPYVGNRPDVMALTANKARAKAVVAAAGVSVPRGEVLAAGEPATLAPPVVVKPVDADNSVGLGLVRDPSDYESALQTALADNDRVLVESYVELGREVRCGIVVRDGQLMCLPLEEYNVDAVTRPVRTAGDKIGRDVSGELRLLAKEPARAWIVDREDPLTERVWAAARTCHTALDCRHYSLFDFRIDPDGRPWFLEAGLYCSFARQSVICVMAQAAGVSPAELFALAVETALT